MFGFEWIKRLVSRKPTPVFGMGDGSNVALSHITINKDGSNEEFVFGTVKYEDGCEPDGGHKPVTTIVLGTVGGQSPSTALAMVRQMTPEQIEQAKTFAQEWKATHPPLSYFPEKLGF